MSSHVNVVKCILSLITIDDPLSYSILPTWFVLLLTLWLVSITFIALLLKNRHDKVKANKKKFDSLMICASILSPITLTLVALMKLLEIHLKFPLKSVNYSTIPGCGDLNQDTHANSICV